MSKMKQRIPCRSCYTVNKDHCTGACFTFSRSRKKPKKKCKE